MCKKTIKLLLFIAVVICALGVIDIITKQLPEIITPTIADKTIHAWGYVDGAGWIKSVISATIWFLLVLVFGADFIKNTKESTSLKNLLSMYEKLTIVQLFLLLFLLIGLFRISYKFRDTLAELLHVDLKSAL